MLCSDELVIVSSIENGNFTTGSFSIESWELACGKPHPNVSVFTVFFTVLSIILPLEEGRPVFSIRFSLFLFCGEIGFSNCFNFISFQILTPYPIHESSHLRLNLNRQWFVCR
jgi:hypothetical protein